MEQNYVLDAVVRNDFAGTLKPVARTDRNAA
jgi:hypothetical protein